MPIAYLSRVESVRVLRRAAKGLQLFRDSSLRDHAPVQIVVGAALTFAVEAERQRWDRERMMQAWRDPELRGPFLADVAAAFRENAPRWARHANDNTPDAAWQHLSEDVAAIAQQHFSVRDGAPEARRELSQRRRALLKRRWELRSSSEWTDNMQSALVAVTSALRKETRAEYKAKTAQRVEQLAMAREAGDFASVHRLARLIAGTGIGIRRRDHRLPPVHQPTQAEWRATLAAAGADGGMRCHFIEDWDSEFREYVSSAPQLAPMSPTVADLVDMDWTDFWRMFLGSASDAPVHHGVCRRRSSACC